MLKQQQIDVSEQMDVSSLFVATQMRAEPALSSMTEQELKKTVMPFAQMRMKQTHLLGPDVSFLALASSGSVP